MHVNTTLAQGLQILTASASDKATASKTASVTDDLVKTANGISTHASNVSKQASVAIGNALLGRSDLNGSFSDEDLHQIAKLKAYATGSSWGVEAYDSLDEMPSDIRPTFEKLHAYSADQAAKWKQVSGTHSWNEKVSDATQTIMRQMEEIVISKWTYDADGNSTLPKEELARMSSYEQSFVLNAGAKLKEAVAKLSENATVTGDLIVQKEDGTYSFGKFEVRDKETGALYFNHDGNGTVQFHDKGVVFSEFKTTGDHWNRFDRKAYEQVFQQDLWSDV